MPTITTTVTHTMPTIEKKRYRIPKKKAAVAMSLLDLLFSDFDECTSGLVDTYIIARKKGDVQRQR